MKHNIHLISALLLAASCEAIPETEFTDRPVVCCYMMSGETPSLTVKKVIPFQSDAVFSDENVDSLTITITDMTDGESFLLENEGGGVYGNASLISEEGHTYGLSFMYDGIPVSAQTTVPGAPEDVSFSSKSIEVMSSTPPSMSTKAGENGITIDWKNDEGDYYIVEGRTSSTNAIQDFGDDDYTPSKSFRLSYTQGTSASLSSSDFNYYGTYQIYVMHIRQEYAVFSQGGSTSSTTLVDVQGNIDGAYGIFTGIGSVKTNIKVSKGSSPGPM